MAARSNVLMRPFAASKPSPDSDEVYYLRTSIPAIHDITISGPFHAPEAALPNLRARLVESSRATETFNALTENGPVAQPVLQRGASLPGPVYRVICSEPLLDAAGQPSQRPRPGGGVAVKSMDLIGSYPSASDAKARANEVLGARLSGYPGALPKHVTAVDEGEGAMGAIVTFSRNSTPIVPLIVMVTYDSGVMLDHQGNEM